MPSEKNLRWVLPPGRECATLLTMTAEAMDRERLLIDEIQTELPGFVQACRADAECVVVNQDAFAPTLGNAELLLLGKAIKYAGLVGKEVRIVPTPQRPA